MRFLMPGFFLHQTDSSGPFYLLEGPWNGVAFWRFMELIQQLNPLPGVGYCGHSIKNIFEIF